MLTPVTESGEVPAKGATIGCTVNKVVAFFPGNSADFA